MVSSGHVNLGRLSALAGETYTVTDTGEIRKRPITIPALSNIVFAYHSYARAQRSPFKMDRRGNEWKALQTANAVRDRIMHPKRLEDLEISDAETQSLETAVLWLNGCAENVTETAGSVAEHEEEYLSWTS